MSAPDYIGHVNGIRLMVVDILREVSAEEAARRLSKVPINPASYYGCVTKACQQVELVLRVRWAAAGQRPDVPLARATEAVQLLALAVTAANARADAEWMVALVGRAHDLSRRPR